MAPTRARTARCSRLTRQIKVRRHYFATHGASVSSQRPARHGRHRGAVQNMDPGADHCCRLLAHPEAQGRDSARTGTADGFQINAGGAGGEKGRASAEQAGAMWTTISSTSPRSRHWPVRSAPNTSTFLPPAAFLAVGPRPRCRRTGTLPLDHAEPSGAGGSARTALSLPRTAVSLAAWLPGVALAYLIGPPARDMAPVAAITCAAWSGDAYSKSSPCCRRALR